MATVTLTTTTAEDARIAAALGKFLGLGRDATGPEVKKWLKDQIVSMVKQQEAIAAQAALVLPPDISPT